MNLGPTELNRPWSSKGYLKEATGPLASYFRRQTGDSDEEALELLNAGHAIGNADVCRAFGRKLSWGHRYWRAFLGRYGDALEGVRKVRWKDDGG